jgi:hypothetical protein
LSNHKQKIGASFAYENNKVKNAQICLLIQPAWNMQANESGLSLCCASVEEPEEVSLHIVALVWEDESIEFFK